MQFSLILTIAKETYLPQTAAADTDISWGFCLRTINALEFMQPTSFFKNQPAFQRIFLIFLFQKLPNMFENFYLQNLITVKNGHFCFNTPNEFRQKAANY